MDSSGLVYKQTRNSCPTEMFKHHEYATTKILLTGTFSLQNKGISVLEKMLKLF